jgi:hypothetical protein
LRGKSYSEVTKVNNLKIVHVMVKGVVAFYVERDANFTKIKIWQKIRYCIKSSCNSFSSCQQDRLDKLVEKREIAKLLKANKRKHDAEHLADTVIKKQRVVTIDVLYSCGQLTLPAAIVFSESSNVLKFILREGWALLSSRAGVCVETIVSGSQCQCNADAVILLRRCFWISVKECG